MVVYEPSFDYSLDDAARIAIPYLVMGGSQSRFGLGIPALFDATVHALPRIYLRNPSATHLSHVTGMCAEIDQTREAALVADPALPEPLTTRVATNPSAARAYDLWNMGQILFGLLGPGAGSGRNFCGRVGLNSLRSPDAIPQDGFTDSPPFLRTDAFTLNPGIPEETLVPQIDANRGLLEDVPGRRPSLHAVSHGWLRSKPRSAGNRLQDRLTAGRF